MSKLPENHKFLDLSDYGRPFGRQIAAWLVPTPLTPVHVTLGFALSGLLAILSIFQQHYWAAVFFLILKSILDAADGELARLRKTPSYIGRYLDSVADIAINLLLMYSIWQVTDGSKWFFLLAFLGLQLQGTLYNYYYAILKRRFQGDTTSRIFESTPPKALAGERQGWVTFLFRLYQGCYGLFDRAIYALDRKAPAAKHLPKWLMTAVSTFGLGFQLLVIGLMLAFGLEDFIFPFFIAYSGFIFVFIGIRRYINR
jgi:phosphatidylglycerophosphate synthase